MDRGKASRRLDFGAIQVATAGLGILKAQLVTFPIYIGNGVRGHWMLGWVRPSQRRYGILDAGHTDNRRLLVPVKAWLRKEWILRGQGAWEPASWTSDYAVIRQERGGGAFECGPMALMAMQA